MATAIIPISTHKDGTRTVITSNQVLERTLKDLSITEADLEEYVRQNVAALFPEGEETLLIVGQQVRNIAAGRADLVAIDGQGNIVLIELKRDKDDITTRKEPFEFQAIRYAANYALIKTQQDVVQLLFAPYIERHKQEGEFHQQLVNGLTSSELASRLLAKFLQDNQAQGTLNRYQRIMLVASAFDPQTLSACAWLAQNAIDIRCITIAPIEYNQQQFFKIEQVIPPPALADFFVEVAQSTTVGTPIISGSQPKQALPRMAKLFEWRLISSGDHLYIRDNETLYATIVNHTHVEYQGQMMKYNEWGQSVTGWSAINIYEWSVHALSNKTLDILRREKLEELAQQADT